MTLSESTIHSLLGNRYTLYEPLGAGGMGAVFRATDRLTGQSLALKRLLLPEAGSGTPSNETEDLRLSLSREFRTLASLHHPNVIGVMDYGFDDGQPFFTMELLPKAQTLTDAGAALDTAGKVRLLVETLRGLAYIHRRGVLHQDLKPSNVLVDGSGRVKVLDFGLALQQKRDPDAEEQESSGGTLAYMASERLTEGTATAASDLYAVGVMAYELFARRYPFDKDTVARLIDDILNRQPDYSSLEWALADVLGRLLAKNPADRYPSAEVAVSALCTATKQPLPAESAEIRESYLKASTFVGRDEELTKLRDSLRETLHGKGAAWLVSGESGVGKSRLLDELRMRALIRGALVLRGQGVAEGGLPYQLWREALRQLALSTPLSDLEAGVLKAIVPDIGTLLGRTVADAPELKGEAAQQRLSLTILDVFRRQTQPVVLLLEDLHWADESLEPLNALNRFVAESPWLIVGTYRDDDMPDLPEKLPGMERLRLARLTDDAIEELSAAMLGAGGKQPEVVNLLKRETEGNAFFMVEVVRALAEDAGSLGSIGQTALPEQIAAGGVAAVLRRRLARVPEWAREALKHAAVAGRQIDTEVMKHIVGTRTIVSLPDVTLDDWLNACANAAVLESVEGRWRFTHDKLREAVLADLADSERRELHRQVADAIERVYAADLSPYYGDLVYHYHLAEDAANEYRYARLAGESAAKRYDHHSAITYLERARTLAATFNGSDAVGGEDAIKTLSQLAEAYTATGDNTRAADYLAQVYAFAQKAGDKHSEAKSLAGLGDLKRRQGQYKESEDDYQRALELYRQINDTRGIASTLRAIGIIYDYKGDYPTAEQYIKQALDYARQIQDDHGLLAAACLNSLGTMRMNQNDLDGAMVYFEESLAIKKAANDEEALAATLNNMAIVAFYRGDLATARSHFETNLGFDRKTGNRFNQSISLNNLGSVADQQEDYAGAIVYYEAGLKISREIDDLESVSTFLHNIARTALKQDDFAAAAANLPEALRLALQIRAMPMVKHTLLAFARLFVPSDSPQHDLKRAAELTELVNAQSGSDKPDIEEDIADLQTLIRQAAGDDMLQAASEQVKDTPLEVMAARLLD